MMILGLATWSDVDLGIHVMVAGGLLLKMQITVEVLLTDEFFFF